MTGGGGAAPRLRRPAAGTRFCNILLFAAAPGDGTGPAAQKKRGDRSQRAVPSENDGRI